MPKEEYILKLAELEQEINRVQQQMQAIEQQVLEMQVLQTGLKELEKTKEKSMLANLGKGIFIKTEIKDKNLLVDVGNRTFVKKTISETLKTIEQELEKLMEGKNNLLGKMQQIQQETQQTIERASEKAGKEK